VETLKDRIQTILDRGTVGRIWLYLTLLSYKAWFINLFKRDMLIVNEVHKGQSILLIALFEKSYLRKDIVRLLELSKKAGLYVIAVNTRKLGKQYLTDYNHLFDVYIQQYNFGRDFGSYKKGFSYIFKHNLNRNSERVLMLNDSLYYDAERVPKFIDDMTNTSVEVLGATENFEINYHLGSFAISFAKSITTHRKFIRYWNNYRLSDIRPTVIKRGEMGLSKLLAQIVTNEFEMKALYDAYRVRKFLEDTPDLIKSYSVHYRNSNLVHWGRLSSLGLSEDFISGTRLNYERKTSTQSNMVKITRDEFRDRINDVHITDIDSALTYFERLKHNNEDLIPDFYDYAVQQSVKYSRFGSQIHQNNACFVFMGLPIIKLDGLYRGMFSERDISNFKKLLRPDYYDELIEILYKKPYGEHFLHGWKRVAFMHGLI